MNPNELPSFLQPLVIITAMAALIKFLVADKLKAITDGINGHEKRIRRVEITNANLHGALRARGCLSLEQCPLIPDDPEEDDR